MEIKKQNTIFILGSGASHFLNFPLLNSLHKNSLLILCKELISSIKKESLINKKLKENILSELLKYIEEFEKDNNKYKILILKIFEILKNLEEKNCIEVIDITRSNWIAGKEVRSSSKLYSIKNISDMNIKWNLMLKIFEELYENKENTNITTDEISYNLNKKTVRPTNNYNIGDIYLNYLVKPIIKNINDNININESSEWWYKYIYKYFEFQNFFIINFNYDTSFEKYTQKNLSRTLRDRILPIHGTVDSDIEHIHMFNSLNHGNAGNINNYKESETDYFSVNKTQFHQFLINGNGKKIWIFPNLSYKNYKYQNNSDFKYNKVDKIIFIGFGFHKTNLQGLGLLDDKGYFHENFDPKIIIINPISEDKNVFEKIQNLFRDLGKSQEEKKVLILDKKVGIENSDKFFLSDLDWQKIQNF